uniref:Zinc finger RING-type eukaryotic domain-containing protein n=1 Tax=Chrysemys picta bellii TaxID=8478 RepID=A0A8C3HCQ7_CHRPI
ADAMADELTCPICLEYFKDPVSLDCDHNFCRAFPIMFYLNQLGRVKQKSVKWGIITNKSKLVVLAGTTT